MVSKSRSLGNVGKGLSSAWLTSGGLQGETGSEPRSTKHRVLTTKIGVMVIAIVVIAVVAIVV